jgi:hypothetical protein
MVHFRLDSSKTLTNSVITKIVSKAASEFLFQLSFSLIG